MLVLSLFSIIVGASAMACDQEILHSTFKLETPKWEQVEYGMSDKGVIVRVFPVIPPELRDCLQSWSVIRRNTEQASTLEAKYAPTKAFSDEKIVVNEYQSEPIAILARFNSGEGKRLINLMSPQAMVNAADCQRFKPETVNLTVSQVSYGEVQVSWDLKVRDEVCTDLYSYGVQFAEGADFSAINNHGGRMVMAEKGERSVVFNTVKDKDVVYRMVRVKTDGDAESWHQRKYSRFMSTTNGGCSLGNREPRFKGNNLKPLVSVNPADDDHSWIIVTINWDLLVVDNKDCAVWFNVQWFRSGYEYDDESRKVPGNQTSIELQFKRESYQRAFEVRVAPSYGDYSYFQDEWRENSATASFEI